VQQGGVSINGNKITDVTYDVVFDGEQILKVGKRKFLKLIAK
jgi:tyrosyl-tRNA synthetase